ncbi:MAG: branched-chain amino acid ABC transporter permease [Deltaproteobacteria bacterium]|nr:branched-chain amino acid ABC transporter permease [Deltaproteobacteria bacterium]MBW2046614.1 branched-chain amino acid ABC transporter permease [Deltaproteobacteria bacterium]MBW2299487.1 branched-chain amino acid ABC transporter permease [Deltaproteobacteria bacterium]
MIQEIVSGLSIGCIYAMTGFGFVLIYNAVGAVNFAYGEIVMFGGYFGYLAIQSFGWSLGLAFLFSILAMAGLGIFNDYFAYFPMRHRPVVTVIIASIGLSILLRNSALAIWGPDPVKIKSFVGDQLVHIGNVVFPLHQLLIFIVTAFIFVGQVFFFSRTSIGRKLEATAQDQEMAKLMGIKVNRMILLTFVLAACLASIAGFLLAPLWFLEPDVGLYIIVKAFIAIVIGGFGSVYGLMAGGLFLGVTEVLVASHLTSEYKDVISFLILVTVLIVLPQGFFGEKVAEKV